MLPKTQDTVVKTHTLYSQYVIFQGE